MARKFNARKFEITKRKVFGITSNAPVTRVMNKGGKKPFNIHTGVRKIGNKKVFDWERGVRKATVARPMMTPASKGHFKEDRGKR